MSENDKEEQSEKKEKSKMEFTQPSKDMLNSRDDPKVMSSVLDSLAVPLATLVNNINTLKTEASRAFALQLALGIILGQSWLTGYTKLGLLAIVKDNFFNMMHASHQHTMQQQFKEVAKKMSEESEKKLKENPYIT